MQETQNARLVQDAYAAFLRGDVQGVLGTLDDNIVWKAVTGAGPDVPMGGERRGKVQVSEFFRQLGENLKFSTFEPREYVAQGDKVVTLGHYKATTTRGGGFDSDFVMVFTVRNGKITEFHEFLDSAALNAAFAGTGAAA